MYRFKRYINPKPEQIEFWTTQANYVACDCGRGSGKSDIAYNRMTRALLTRWPGQERNLFLVGLPTQEQANKVAWDKIEPLLPKGTIARVNRGMNYIDTVFNNRLYVKGMFNSARSEGVQYTGVILDEMSDMPPNIFDSLLPAMAHKCRFCFCIGVPKRNGIGAANYRNICEKWERNALDGDARYARFHWTSIGIISPEKIQEAQDALDPKGFREQYLAAWETASGAVYYSFDRNENLVDDTPIDPKKPLLIGCDFNVSPMSWVVCQADLNSSGGCKGTITVNDEIRLTDTNTREALDYLWQLYPNHPGGYRFYGDAASCQRHTTSTAAAPSDYTIIAQDVRYYDRRQGIVDLNFPASNPPVLDRVESVCAMLKNAAGNARIKINKKCEHLIKDLERVSFKKGSRMIEKADLELTHMSDALGYLVYFIAPIGYDPNEKTGAPTGA